MFVAVNVYILIFHLRHNMRTATNVVTLFWLTQVSFLFLFLSLFARGSPTTLLTHVDHEATTKTILCPERYFVQGHEINILTKLHPVF